MKYEKKNSIITNIRFFDLKDVLITTLDDVNFNPYNVNDKVTLLIKHFDESLLKVRQESQIKSLNDLTNDYVEMYHNKTVTLYSQEKFMEFDVLGNTIIDIHYKCIIHP